MTLHILGASYPSRLTAELFFSAPKSSLAGYGVDRQCTDLQLELPPNEPASLAAPPAVCVVPAYALAASSV